MSTTILPKRFYVYTLSISADMSKVFYVGKGTGNRTDQHAREAQGFHCCVKCAVIRYALRKLGQYWWSIEYETNDSSEAVYREMKLITSYPYGSLCNTLGGYNPGVTASSVRQKDGEWSGTLTYEDGTSADISGVTRDLAAREMAVIFDRMVLLPYFKHNRFGIRLGKLLN